MTLSCRFYQYAEEEKGEESKESEKQEEDEHMEEPASGGGERGTGHSVRDSLRQEIAELQASETKGPKSRMLPVDTVSVWGGISEYKWTIHFPGTRTPLYDVLIAITKGL